MHEKCVHCVSDAIVRYRLYGSIYIQLMRKKNLSNVRLKHAANDLSKFIWIIDFEGNIELKRTQ